jgi:hypothetical protein
VPGARDPARRAQPQRLRGRRHPPPGPRRQPGAPARGPASVVVRAGARRRDRRDRRRPRRPRACDHGGRPQQRDARPRPGVRGRGRRHPDLRPGRTFDAVVLGTYLVNVPDPSVAADFLATCRRPVRDDGVVLVQRQAPARFAATVPHVSRDEETGIEREVVQVERNGDLLTSRRCSGARVGSGTPGSPTAGSPTPGSARCWPTHRCDSTVSSTPRGWSLVPADAGSPRRSPRGGSGRTGSPVDGMSAGLAGLGLRWAWCRCGRGGTTVRRDFAR